MRDEVNTFFFVKVITAVCHIFPLYLSLSPRECARKGH
jgi:hypothetical protein